MPTKKAGERAKPSPNLPPLIRQQVNFDRPAQGISAGDSVLVEPSKEARPGQLLSFTYDSEPTLGYVRIAGDKHAYVEGLSGTAEKTALAEMLIIGYVVEVEKRQSSATRRRA